MRHRVREAKRGVGCRRNGSVAARRQAPVATMRMNLGTPPRPGRLSRCERVITEIRDIIRTGRPGRGAQGSTPRGTAAWSTRQSRRENQPRKGSASCNRRARGRAVFEQGIGMRHQDSAVERELPAPSRWRDGVRPVRPTAVPAFQPVVTVALPGRRRKAKPQEAPLVRHSAQAVRNFRCRLQFDHGEATGASELKGVTVECRLEARPPADVVRLSSPRGCRLDRAPYP